MTDTIKIQLWKTLGFSSKEEYLESIVKEKELEPYIEHKERITKQRQQPPIWAREGFQSENDYLLYYARKKGFKSIRKYKEHLAKENFAITKGFKSYTDYEENLVKESIRTIEEQEYIVKHILCSSVKNVISKIKDPESIFRDEEFIKKITMLNKKLSCDIPIIPIKKNNIDRE